MGYAVHPHDATMVVLATDGGLFLSSNNGDSFERIGPAGVVTAASFSPDGQHLYFGSSLLSRYDLASKEVLPMQYPPLAAEDTIGYVAVNPVNPHEVAVATLWPGHFPLHR
jgi:WD40 repeat protein